MEYKTEKTVPIFITEYSQIMRKRRKLVVQAGICKGQLIFTYVHKSTFANNKQRHTYVCVREETGSSTLFLVYWHSRHNICSDVLLLSLFKAIKLFYTECETDITIIRPTKRIISAFVLLFFCFGYIPIPPEIKSDDVTLKHVTRKTKNATRHRPPFINAGIATNAVI